MRLLAAAALLAGLCGAGVFGRADAASWVIIPAQSHLAFSGTQSGQRFSGSFHKFAATISFDPQHLDQSAIKVTIAMASAVTGNAQRDDMMTNADWFDIKQFPVAEFEAARFTKTGPDAYVADGSLTIRDTTRPVQLPFHLQIVGKTAHVVGHLAISRRDFGVGRGEWASADIVGDTVDITCDIVAAAP